MAWLLTFVATFDREREICLDRARRTAAHLNEPMSGAESTWLANADRDGIASAAEAASNMLDLLADELESTVIAGYGAESRVTRRAAAMCAALQSLEDPAP